MSTTATVTPSRGQRGLRERWHHDWRHQWWSNPRTELLAGLLVALALIPEAISFSIIAGVDPKVGLYASFVIATTRPETAPWG